MKAKILVVGSVLSLLVNHCQVIANETIEECVMSNYLNADKSTTLGEMRQICNSITTEQNSTKASSVVGVISNRILSERKTELSPYVITPHKINYILPAYFSSNIDKDVYSTFDGYEDNLKNIETKFQLSFKIPLNHNSLITENDGLYFGFTLEAWWQTYSNNISTPFRETNYQPELFYLAPLTWQPFGGNTGFMLGIEHQSNGRAQNLSRSWNRVYANFLYEKGNLALSFRPWIRIQEADKEREFDPEGDDNPDIEDFMGHYELGVVYKWDQLELSLGGRNNFNSHKGYLEVTDHFRPFLTA